MDRTEVVIVGAGIAGASMAYHLATAGWTDVLLLEKEDAPGYHATGRSAAVFTQLSEDDVFVRLSLSSGPFFRSPPGGFADVPLLRPTGTLLVARGRRWMGLRLLAGLARRMGVVCGEWSPREAAERVPALEPKLLDGGIFLPEDGLLDVHALLWGYLAGARRLGVRLLVGTEVTAVRTEDGRVKGVATNRGEIRCDWLVNAAGAWANRIAALAGAGSMPLTPCRRTIIIGRPDDHLPIGDWPLTSDYSRRFYFRPESGAILASPMDQDPMEPCDARPDELRVAEIADRLARYAPTIAPRQILNKWAGLRTLPADRAPVVGEDPGLRGFFWLAGQAGHGINTSPALGRMAADLLVHRKTDLLDPRLVAPGRFRRGRLSYPLILARRAAFVVGALGRGRT
ncbi:MAG: FAD-binding oxidoreductase [bacterium]